ncbi:MAG TPA: hypothetical protein VJ963_14200 [Bacteroidales bacterium]|nr:hypothetical protein [Bacteroidales bacterium]
MEQYTGHPLYRKHNIDSAMSSLWEFYKKYFIPLFITSFAMSLVIQYATTLFNFQDLQTATDPAVMLDKLRQMIVPILLISLINLLFTNILQYYVLYNPLDRSNNIFISAIKSLKFFIPYLIIMILLAFAGGIAVFLGFFVIVIGAFFAMLYVMTIYLFILPVLMIEGPNISNAIPRTLKLAHKNFWHNIGWVAVFLILMIVISIILSGIILLPFTGSFIKSIVNPQAATDIMDKAKSPLFIILSALVSAVTLPLMPIFSAILYFNGRASEEQQAVIIETVPEEPTLRVEDLYAKPYADDHPDNPDRKKEEEDEEEL